MSEHLTALDMLKTALTTAPLLGYQDCLKQFILETKGPDAVLSKEDASGKVCVTTYASRIYDHPNNPYITIAQPN